MVRNSKEKELSTNEKKVLLALEKLGGRGKPDEILKVSDFKNESEVMNALSWLRFKGLVNLREYVRKLYSLGKEGKKLVEKGLPEKRALKLLIDRGEVDIEELKTVLEEYEIPIAIGWLKKRNWAIIERDAGKIKIRLSDKGKKESEIPLPEEEMLLALSKTEWLEIEDERINLLKARKGVVEEKEKTVVEAELTDKGRDILKKGIEIKDEITQITSDIIRRGIWREKTIRPYSIDVFVSPTYGGKPHPLALLREEVREIFLEMGFEEIEGNYVESCFWNMDVLFIPQDHPARDMQDTLYCKNLRAEDIDEELLKIIKEIHENGSNTGSKGWRVPFSEKESRKILL
ncbi:MAG: phenylalanine--tRNA ligase subunit alpha, partial [Thermotogae bacterium]